MRSSMNARLADFLMPLTALMIVSGLTSILRQSASSTFLRSAENMSRYHRLFPRLLSVRPSVGSSNRSERFAQHSPAGHRRPCRRSGDPPRRGPEGKLELTEVARLTNRA